MSRLRELRPSEMADTIAMIRERMEPELDHYKRPHDDETVAAELTAKLGRPVGKIQIARIRRDVFGEFANKKAWRASPETVRNKAYGINARKRDEAIAQLTQAVEQLTERVDEQMRQSSSIAVQLAALHQAIGRLDNENEKIEKYLNNRMPNWRHQKPAN